MRSFVIFKDTVVFNKEKVWDIREVKHKCPKTEIRPMFVGYVDVVFGDKKLQKGLLINAENEHDALERLNEWMARSEKYSYQAKQQAQ
jgi:hypothetical protein